MENFSKSKESVPKKSSLLKSLLVSALISIPTIMTPQEKNKTDIPDKNNKNITEQKDEGFKIPDFKSFNATDRLFAMDENNNTYINPWVIITPLQIEVGTETEHHDKTLIRIPYKYSRSFNTAEAQSEEQKKEAANYIEEMLKKEFVEKLIFLDPTSSTKDVYKYHHKGEELDLSKVKIENIKITGLSSPEGPEEKGKNTLAIGNIDKENIRLSEKRAKDMDPEIKSALKVLGFETDAISEISGEEIQFNETELATLDSLAKSIGINDTVDELESTFILVKEYNEGKIKDQNVISKLDTIVGSKRMVEIEITYDEGKKEKYVVPIPLTLLLLIPGIRWLRREKVRERFKKTTTEDPALLAEGRNHLSIHSNSPVFRNLYNTTINSVETKQDSERIAERLLIDEFNPYFGTRKDDVDYFYYMMMATNTNNAEPVGVERAIAFDLLMRWELNDRSVRLAREFVGMENELHYWQEPQKILWAREAARHLVHYAEIYERHQREGMPFPETAVYEEIRNEIRDLRNRNYIIPERRNIRTARVPSGNNIFDNFMNRRHPFIRRKKE